MKKPLGSLQGHLYTNSNLNIKGTFVALFLSRKLNRHCAVFLFLFYPSLSVIQRHGGLSCRALDSDAEGCGFAFYPWPVAGKTPSLHFTQHKNFPYRVESSCLPASVDVPVFIRTDLWTPGCGVFDTENWLLKPMSNVRVDMIGLNNLCLFMSSFCFV